MNLEISPSDVKKYRILELENGLKVTLISQPPTNENEEMPCAASMVVGAGFYHEPRGIPGLAHFCEHLLFMGSEKYPEENTFEQFVAKHGGYYNASTNETFTRYYVSSNHDIKSISLKYPQKNLFCKIIFNDFLNTIVSSYMDSILSN